MTKRERIQTIHDSLCNYSLSFGTNDAYKLIIDAFTEMLLVLAEDPDNTLAARLAEAEAHEAVCQCGLPMSSHDSGDCCNMAVENNPPCTYKVQMEAYADLAARRGVELLELGVRLKGSNERASRAEAADLEALDSLWKMTNRCNDWRDRYILLERAVVNYIRSPEGCGQEEYKALEQAVSMGDGL
jgi:hypothetical protein